MEAQLLARTHNLESGQGGEQSPSRTLDRPAGSESLGRIGFGLWPMRYPLIRASNQRACNTPYNRLCLRPSLGLPLTTPF